MDLVLMICMGVAVVGIVVLLGRLPEIMAKDEVERDRAAAHRRAHTRIVDRWLWPVLAFEAAIGAVVAFATGNLGWGALLVGVFFVLVAVSWYFRRRL